MHEELMQGGFANRPVEKDERKDERKDANLIKGVEPYGTWQRLGDTYSKLIIGK